MSLSQIGDETFVPCPTCGKQMNIQDITTDGCLKPGFVSTCEHCSAEFEIDDVEFRAEVWVKPHRKA